MKITLIEVDGFQKLKHAKIEPDGRAMILIGGKNKSGKSSLLRAIRSALGGSSEKPADPINDDSERATIKIELDDGAIAIVKEFRADGKAYLEVRSDKLGKVTSPQKTLDKIVGNRFLDPLAFVRMSDKDQRAKLLSIIDVGIDLDDNEDRRAAAFRERTDRNRAAKQVRAELAGIDDPGDPGEKIDIIKIMSQIDELTERSRKSRDAKDAIEKFGEKQADAQSDLDYAQSALDEAKAKMQALDEEIAKKSPALEAMAAEDAGGEAGDLRAELAKADGHNSEVEKKKAAIEQRRRLAEKAESVESEAIALTDKLASLAKERADALAAAKMPVPGLDVGDKGVILNGHPLANASGAEQMMLSLAIASAASPELKDICIEDASLLDDDSLEIVKNFSEANGLQVWLERVGTADDGCIVIDAGEIV